MKKIATLACIGMLVAGVGARADELDKNCGCGLGSQWFEGRDSMLSQVGASLVNSVLFFNQAFGISFGTFGCEQPLSMVKNDQLKRFVAANLTSLAQDIAAGSGESLATVAELMLVPLEEAPEFFSALQANYLSIFPTLSVTEQDVITAMTQIYARI